MNGPRPCSRVIAGTLVFLVCLVLACTPSSEPSPAEQPPRGWARHVVLITLGRTRADHMSLAGHVRNTCEPTEWMWMGEARRIPGDHTLTVLSRQGTYFPRAFVPTSERFTSLHGWLMGCTEEELDRDPQRPSLAAHLRSHGFRTVALLSGSPFPEHAPFLEGFDTRHDELMPDDLFPHLDRLVLDPPEKLFLWVHLDLPGSPVSHVVDRLTQYPATFLKDLPRSVWELRAEALFRFAERREAFSREMLEELSGRYDGRLVYLHDCLRWTLWMLAERSRILPDAFLAVTSDRGCELGEREGYVGMDRSARDAALAVPLFVRSPAGVPADRIDPRLVAAADLYPTVLRALDLASPGPLAGRDLFLPLAGGRMIRGRSANGARTLRTERYRLIEPALVDPGVPADRPEWAGGAFHRSIELYDLWHPLGESINMRDRLPDLVSILRAYLLER